MDILPKNIIVRLNRADTYRHLFALCQNDGLFAISSLPVNWRDDDYERIVISDAQSLREGQKKAVIGTLRLLPFDNGTTIMFVNKDAFWHTEITETGGKLFTKFFERTFEHFTELDLIYHKQTTAKNTRNIESKKVTMSSTQKRLAQLRDELSEMHVPSFPGDPFMPLKNWVTKATPIIRSEWAEDFNDFADLNTIGGWTNNDMVTFADLVTVGITTPNSSEHRQAWDKDAKDAQELCQKYMHYLDGLILLPPKNHKNSPTNTTGNIIIQNSQVETFVGPNSNLTNSVIGKNYVNSIHDLLEPAYRKIENSEFPEQEKQDLKSEIVDIESEIKKGNLADESFLTRRLRMLKKMAPDIADVMLASLTGPGTAAAMIIKKVAERVKAETTN